MIHNPKDAKIIIQYFKIDYNGSNVKETGANPPYLIWLNTPCIATIKRVPLYPPTGAFLTDAHQTVTA